jgi:5S rRNA maturation endonuclease (ribonuclease M5)
MDISIIVEGEDDYNFLDQFIAKRFQKKVERKDFIIINGKSETIHLSQSRIQASTNAGKRNILIFDADDSGYASTIEKIGQKEVELGIKFDAIFLWPNHQESGNLETLLAKIVSLKYSIIFRCIESYGECTAKLGLNNLRGISEKEKFFIYHGSFVDESGSIDKKGAQPSKRNYSFSDLWDLKSQHLEPLRKFIEPLL